MQARHVCTPDCRLTVLTTVTRNSSDGLDNVVLLVTECLDLLGGEDPPDGFGVLIQADRIKMMIAGVPDAVTKFAIDLAMANKHTPSNLVCVDEANSAIEVLEAVQDVIFIPTQERVGNGLVSDEPVTLELVVGDAKRL